MTVVIRDSDWAGWLTLPVTCTGCGDETYPPFVWWWADEHLFFCIECCSSMQRGLTVDMMRAAAIRRARKQRRDETIPVQ
jgi:hypothetical protein